jgi:hypothetical protein
LFHHIINISRLAKVFKKNADLGGIAGTEGYIAPEVYSSNIIDATKIDVYSYGMVIYELITHQVPYPDIQDSFQIIQLSITGQRPPIHNEQDVRNSDNIMNQLIDLFYKCTELEPEKRPSFDEITKILFFPIPGRIELIVDPTEEPNHIQTFDKIQTAIDAVREEVLHAPLPRTGSIPNKNIAQTPILKNRAKKLPTMTDERYRTVVPATRSLRPPLVHIMPGTYHENLTLTRNVELKAEGLVTLIPEHSNEPVVIMSNCGGATFRNFTFPQGNIIVKGVDSRSHFKDCVFKDVTMTICDRSNSFITRCKYENCNVKLTDQDTRSTLFKNEIMGQVTITNGSGALVQGCHIHNSQKYGVEIGPGCKPCILDCEIYACSSAIYIGAGGDPMIENNKIHDNHIGVETDEEAIGLLRKNQLTGNKQDFKIADSATTWNEDMFLNATTQDDDEF